MCNELLGKSKIEAYPTNNCKNELPNMFSSYFNDKVSTIRASLDTHNIQSEFMEFQGDTILMNFEPVTREDLKKIILNSPKSFCELDPLPSNLFLECIDIIIPLCNMFY